MRERRTGRTEQSCPCQEERCWYWSPTVPVVGMLGAAGAVLVYYITMSRRKFGGVTGDLAGFFLQLCELGMLAGLVCAQLMGGAL